jgi:hypothetical protein
MKRLVARAISAIVLACLPFAESGTWAQLTSYEVLWRENIEQGKRPGDGKAEAYVRKVTLCAVWDQSAETIMRSYPASAKSDQTLAGMIDGGRTCGDDRMQFSARYSRGTVAEYMLKRDFDLATWKSRGKLTKVFPTPTNDQLAKLSADSRSAIVLTEIGECVVKASPRGVGALLTAEPGTPEENAAFSAVTPALADCIPPGVELKMSKFELRGYLAEGAYRYAAAMAAGTK